MNCAGEPRYRGPLLGWSISYAKRTRTLPRSAFTASATRAMFASSEPEAIAAAVVPWPVHETIGVRPVAMSSCSSRQNVFVHGR